MYEESLRMPFLVRWPARIKPGTKSDAMALNIDFAPTFLDVAGLPASSSMQGRSLLPALIGRPPSEWRTSMYYRYYHDPGDHNTRAHYGVRTRTHKLIYFWRDDQWECYDLQNDPRELNNIHADPASAAIVERLKASLDRLKQEVGDRDQFADEQPGGGVDARPKKSTP